MPVSDDLGRLGYRLDPGSSIWTRPSTDGDPFSYSDGDESEERIARIVHNAADRSVYSRDLAQEITDWPSRYHLSPMRSNLLRPFASTMKGPVLEIGAGMGAVTRGLGEAELEVVALEGSRRRAAIAAERCGDLATVHVVADTLQNFQLEARFNTIVVVGVLEYARVFFGAESPGDPVDAMLTKLRSLLSPGGILYLAIENQLGLKYLAGYPEDHTNEPMLGIEDRYRDDSVVTFGKRELSRRLSAAGFSGQDWWYPFPDYKLPTSILSDGGVHSRIDVGSMAADSVITDWQRPAITTFALQRAWDVVARNGLAGELANSFLVRASDAAITASDDLAVHFGADHDGQAVTAVRFEAVGDSIEISRSLISAATQPSDVAAFERVIAAHENFVAGTNWRNRLVEILITPGWSVHDVAEWAARWWREVIELMGVTPGSITAETLVDRQLLDAIPRNLIVDGDKARFVDLGWRAPQPFPLQWLLFRGLYNSFTAVESAASPTQGTPVNIGRLITEVTARLGHPLSSIDIERAWASERLFRSHSIGTDALATAGEAPANEIATRPPTQQLFRLAAEGIPLADRLKDQRNEIDELHHRVAALQREAAGLNSEVSRRGERIQELEVADHSGEANAEGTDVAASLDLVYYRRRNPDVQHFDDDELRTHYENFGRKEGRRSRAFADSLDFPLIGLASDKPAVLMVVRESTSTGVDILAWNIARGMRESYNVVVFAQQSGALAATFADVANALVSMPGDVPLDEFEYELIAQRLAEIYRPRYAIVSTIECRDFVAPLELMHVPTIALIHEFAENNTLRGAIVDIVSTASALVFPTDGVADSAFRAYQKTARSYGIKAPGKIRWPSTVGGANRNATPVPDLGNDFVVLGVGPVNWREGVEFFVQTAAALERTARGRSHFLWVGRVSASDRGYLELLMSQAALSGARVTFIPEAGDLAPFFDRADAFFVSSRHDPMPIAALEAMDRGIPVVAFDRAGWISEILLADPALSSLVVPYLDSTAAANMLHSLLTDERRMHEFSHAISALSARRSDMPGYIEWLDDLGGRATDALTRRAEERSVLLEAGAFNADLYWGNRQPRPQRPALVDHYLARSRLALRRGIAGSGQVMRRPLEGFNPLAYSAEAPDFDDHDLTDPLVDWIRRGRPDGPWSHEVIRPTTRSTLNGTNEQPRVLVHGHFHYTDSFEDLLQRLAANSMKHDVVLTTDTQAKADLLRSIAQDRGLQPEILIVPNMGRDVGPLLTRIGANGMAHYDAVLHVHGKRSIHSDDDFGNSWRNFLFDSLVAAHTPDGWIPTADAVVAAFAADPGLGVVFAEDPGLNGWDDNLTTATGLAQRMSLRSELPQYFDFPAGTMFWARPGALAPLLRLRLDWSDYPTEPLPLDGTMLHALERLIPIAAADAGYRYATTSVAGAMRRTVTPFA